MNTILCPFPLFQRPISAFTEDPRREAFLRVGTTQSPLTGAGWRAMFNSLRHAPRATARFVSSHDWITRRLTRLHSGARRIHPPSSDNSCSAPVRNGDGSRAVS